jgi:hypothetical protein
MLLFFSRTTVGSDSIGSCRPGARYGLRPGLSVACRFCYKDTVDPLKGENSSIARLEEGGL